MVTIMMMNNNEYCGDADEDDHDGVTDHDDDGDE